ncbi:glycosyltransferase family A protein [Lutibacter sp.]
MNIYKDKLEKNIIFTLIMATCGRKKEVRNFLISLSKQTFDLNKVELIIVDQNDKIQLGDIVAEFYEKMNLVHIKSDVKGLSINRNKGLDVARGKIVAFPDDDCTYYEDTLQSVFNFFEKSPETALVLGKIYDRDKKKNIIRNWKDESFRVTKWNFFKNYSSITIFSKNLKLKFEEKFGQGQYFGSYEDADYVYQSLMLKTETKFSPNIQVLHPELNKNVMTPEKIESYGLGLGAFVKKHKSFPIYLIFFQVLAYHIVNMIVSCLLLKKQAALKSWKSFASRLIGYKEYPNIKVKK